MIFVCVGSREYPFDRLLKKLDELAGLGAIRDEIFAQIGKANYLPRFFEYKRFISKEEFNDYQLRADLIISHGGTGALIGALKLGKKVIAVPRLARYGEHLDDHQTQVCEVLEREGYLRQVLDMSRLLSAYRECMGLVPVKKFSRPSLVVGIIGNYIRTGVRGSEK